MLSKAENLETNKFICISGCHSNLKSRLMTGLPQHNWAKKG